jgi:hypothetical protein
MAKKGMKSAKNVNLCRKAAQIADERMAEA